MMIPGSLAVAWRVLQSARSQWWSPHKIQRAQEEKLRETLRFALTHVEHYKQLGIDASDITTAADLARFPILTKQALQAAGDRLLGDTARLGACMSSTTSGSAGEPTTTVFDPQSWRLTKYALKIRRLLANGVGIGKRVLIVSELSPKELATNRGLFGEGLLYRKRHVSIHEPVATGASALASYRPHAVYAFPSYLAELIEHYERSGTNPPPLDRIFTSSELLTDRMRNRIEIAFSTTICDVYGSAEFKEVAWQCRAGRYHINFESTWVEVVDQDPNGVGAILLTSLVNRAMPLIRYRVGDRGRLTTGSCDCGRHGPSLSMLSGREVDSVILPDGRSLSPYLLTSAIENEPHISRYLIHQNSKFDFDVRYIPCGRVDECRLKRRLRRVLGSSVRIHTRSVEQLPRTSRGKQMVFVRKFDQPSTRN